MTRSVAFAACAAFAIALACNACGGAEAAAPPSATPGASEKASAESPEACRDGVEIVLRAPSRAGFVPGTYQLVVTAEGSRVRVVCKVDEQVGSSTCSADPPPATAAMMRKDTEISVVVPGSNKAVDLDVSRNGTPIAQTTVHPVYETKSDGHGGACTTAFVALGLK